MFCAVTTTNKVMTSTPAYPGKTYSNRLRYYRQQGLRIKEGINCRMGIATLVAGQVVITNTTVTVNTRIFLTHHTLGGTPGYLGIKARTAGTSFTIASSVSTDTSIVAYLMMEPA